MVFTWARIEINPTNRDRRGGHQCTALAAEDIVNASAGRKFAKRKQAKKLRKEHQRITRDAVHSYYADGADDRYDYLYGDDYMDDYFDNTFMEPEWDEHEDYIEDDYDYGSYDFYDHDPYDPFDDYQDIWAISPVTPEDTRRIEREDIGKSLGDILEEIRQRQGL